MLDFHSETHFNAWLDEVKHHSKVRLFQCSAGWVHVELTNKETWNKTLVKCLVG